MKSIGATYASPQYNFRLKQQMQYEILEIAIAFSCDVRKVIVVDGTREREASPPALAPEAELG